ncbi:MAG TPA: hypothetical protein VN625_00785, partial [Desulfuromonadaceae bacterium]|nr:hypothetical protein [Desulfuromonadaceae bacterium]
MSCPHCHENLPASYDSPWCPYCGKNLERIPNTSSEPYGGNPQSSWLFFWIVLSTPSVIDFSLLTFVSNSMGMLGIAAVVSIIGSLVAGII